MGDITTEYVRPMKVIRGYFMVTSTAVAFYIPGVPSPGAGALGVRGNVSEGILVLWFTFRSNQMWCLLSLAESVRAGASTVEVWGAVRGHARRALRYGVPVDVLADHVLFCKPSSRISKIHRRRYLLQVCVLMGCVCF